MLDVTDFAFRQRLSARGARPDVFYTEFVSADGLCNEIARPKLLRELYFEKNEHPIVAQIFGSKPENIEKAAKLVAELGFDGVEINMGCPDATIIKQGAGAALIRTPELAKEIILAAKRGAGDVPVSVKTRLGFSRLETESWAKTLLETKPAALTFHLRTKKEMSKAPAHWEEIRKIVQLAAKTDTLIIGNGDITSLAEAREKASDYGLAGTMIGRGFFADPWLLAEREVKIEEKIREAIKHTEMFAKYYLSGGTNDKLFSGHTKSFALMKKHYSAYFRGFRESASWRKQLMEAGSPQEAIDVMNSFSKPDSLL